MSTDLRAAARSLAVRSYRKVGALGRQVLGEDPAAPAAPPAPAAAAAGADPVAPPAPAAPDADNPPWLPLPDAAGVICNICRWQGDAFGGRQHVEFSQCPACGSNGRDRFLHWCLTQRVDLDAALRVIECSPRLGEAYREAMSTWFFYRTSDYDLRAHRGNLHLDLQAIDLPDACLDVVLCAHVLEHVPDTGKALSELRRTIAPGGHLLLQVPVLQGRTAPPPSPSSTATTRPSTGASASISRPGCATRASRRRSCAPRRWPTPPARARTRGPSGRASSTCPTSSPGRSPRT